MKRISLQNLSGRKATLVSCTIVLLTLAGAAGCKKSGDSSASTANLLTSAPWQRTKVEWQTTAGAWVDRGTSYSDLPISAGTVTFADNGTYLLLGGKYGTWKLSDDKTQLSILTSGGAASTIAVATLTGAGLQLTVPLTNEYTVTYNPYVMTSYTTERDTYTH